MDVARQPITVLDRRVCKWSAKPVNVSNLPGVIVLDNPQVSTRKAFSVARSCSFHCQLFRASHFVVMHLASGVSGGSLGADG